MGALSLADVAAIVINVPGTIEIGTVKISDLVSQAEGDVYEYIVPATDNVVITETVTITGRGRTQVNTGTLDLTGCTNTHVRCVNFSGAVTGAGANGNIYHPICGRGPSRMGMNPN